MRIKCKNAMLKCMPILTLFLLAIIVSACSNTEVKNMENVVKSGDVVKVEYTGTLDSGQKFDSSEGREPLQFKVGSGQVIKGFDDALIGMNIGETKKIRIPAEEAYGQKNDALIQKVPKEMFGENFSFKEGDLIAISDPESGRQFPAEIKGISDDAVTLDLNHQLAGQALTFEIKLISIGE